MDPHHLRRQLHRVLRRADDALAGEQHAHGRQGGLGDRAHAARAQQEPAPDRGEAEQRRERPVLVDRPVERVRALPVEPRDDVARALAAGVRAGSGGDRAGGERHRAEHDEPADRPQAHPVARPHAGPGLVRRAPGEHHAGHEQQHREQEVADHPARLQPVPDRHPAQHGLREHAERQQQRDEREIAPERPPAPGEQRRGQARQPDDPGQHPVAELDQGMRRELGREARARAARPVRAAEPGSREPHGGAGEDDQRADDERRERDVEVRAGGDGEAGEAAHAGGEGSAVGQGEVEGDLARGGIDAVLVGPRVVVGPRREVRRRPRPFLPSSGRRATRPAGSAGVRGRLRSGGTGRTPRGSASRRARRTARPACCRARGSTGRPAGGACPTP